MGPDRVDLAFSVVRIPAGHGKSVAFPRLEALRVLPCGPWVNRFREL